MRNPRTVPPLTLASPRHTVLKGSANCSHDWSPVNEQRKNQRFELKLPLELVRSGSTILGKPGETLNLSSAGVKFFTQGLVEVGEPIEYFITLPGSGAGPEVRIRCLGKVLRREGDSVVAATLERYEFVRAKGASNGH